MKQSYPSAPLYLIDVPEVSLFNAKFVYNFFVKNEKTDDNGTPYDLSGYVGHDTTSKKSVSTAKKLLHQGVARYIRLNWAPIIMESKPGLGTPYEEGQNLEPSAYESEFINNVGKIQSELEISAGSTSALVLQDFGIQSRLSRFINFSLALRDLPAASVGTPAEKAKKLNELTPDWVVGNILFDNAYTPVDNGVGYVNVDTGLVTDASRNFGVGEQSLYAQFHSRYIGAVVRNSSTNALQWFNVGLSEQSEAADTIQDAARQDGNSAAIVASDYMVNLTPISVLYQDNSINVSQVYNSVQVVGYIIEKTEILADGSRLALNPIIIPNRKLNSWIDANVKYGAVYSYEIKSVVRYVTRALNYSDYKYSMVTSLISSRPSVPVVVSCEEFTPPPPPSDFTIIWDYGPKNLRLLWSLPVVRTRDVKRFQVFRRNNITQPFELLCEYDFDDSEQLTPRKELPDPTRLKLIDGEVKPPVTSYVDLDFKKDSTYIYSLCCIDAHDFTSNYSEQFQVSFDLYKNKINVKRISPSGAPKAYPNFYLSPHLDDVPNSQLTVDAIKDSDHKHLKIYFDPEYSKIENSDGADLELFSSKDLGTVYKLQLINIDRQKSVVIDMAIDDLRTPPE